MTDNTHDGLNLAESPGGTVFAVNKPVRNVFDKNCTVLFGGKSNLKSREKVAGGKIQFKNTTKANSPVVKKRCSLDVTVSQTRPCKKVRLEDLETHKETCPEKASCQERELDVAACMLPVNNDATAECSPDISKTVRTSDSLNITENAATDIRFSDTKKESCAELQLNLQSPKSILDEAGEPQTLNKERDSGFQETFRILGEPSDSEKQCSSLSSSPDLFSPVCSHSSSGLTSSSSSKTFSPDQQSSITKYFPPVRTRESSQSSRSNTNLSPYGKRNSKPRKDLSPSSPVSGKKEQMYLDLGQKNFGHVTCPTCNMVYTQAQPDDEAVHLKFHRKFINGLRFLGQWKTERVVEYFDDGRVVVVLPHDHFTHQKKVTDVRSVVDSELGFSSETSQRMKDAQTYMFITNKKVVGCVVAVEIEKAYTILPSESEDRVKKSDLPGAWCCSSTPVRAQCGISRVWVLQQYRRKGIATRLLDCVRKQFIFGCVVSKEALAFSDPTPLGKRLAESYSGTESFLVFR